MKGAEPLPHTGVTKSAVDEAQEGEEHSPAKEGESKHRALSAFAKSMTSKFGNTDDKEDKKSDKDSTKNDNKKGRNDDNTKDDKGADETKEAGANGPDTSKDEGKEDWTGTIREMCLKAGGITCLSNHRRHPAEESEERQKTRRV